ALASIAVLTASSGRVADDDAVTSAVYQSPQDLVISLNTAAAHPKVGLPNFIVTAGDPELQQAANTVADVLWNDLDFENDYYMISRKASATVPISDSVDALPFERWTELGADLVILGNARRTEGGFQVDVRIIGVKGR